MIKQIKDLSAATLDDLNDNCQFVMDDSNDKTKRVSFNVLKQKIGYKEEILNLIYPIGSIYLDGSNGEVCPLTSVITGSEWQKIGNKLLTDGSTAPVVGTGSYLGLDYGENHGALYGQIYNSSVEPKVLGTVGLEPTALNPLGVSTDPEKSGLVADLGDVTGITVAIWERTK